jgi:hypothetical protein
MPLPPLMIDWTVRLSMLLLSVVWLGQLAGLRSTAWQRTSRWMWTLGFLLGVAHVAAAFHYVHHWSHADAVADTARRTAEQLGWPVGAGVFFNYAFIGIWGLDVARWWVWPRDDSRGGRGWRLAVDGYLAFIAFSATVVFESGPIRWFGIAVTWFAAMLLVRRLVWSRSKTMTVR